MSKNRNPKIIDGTCRVIDEGKPEGGENVNQEQKENKAPEQEQKNQETKDDQEVGFFKKHKKKFIVAGAGLLIAGLSFWFGNWTGSKGTGTDDDSCYLPFPEDDDEEQSEVSEEEE